VYPVPRTIALAAAVATAVIVSTLLGACGDPPPPRVADLASLRPADADLAERYERSCQLCHAQRGSGAPLVGDTAAWAPRAQRGEAALLASVMQGLGTMPPRGLCPDCSNTDLQRLIVFLQKPQAATP
jgi:cytochrome c5